MFGHQHEQNSVELIINILTYRTMIKICQQIRAFSSKPISFYDVVIVGGGLVGGTMACSIGRSTQLSQSIKVLVLESGRHDSETSSGQYSNRVSAVNPSSVKMLQTIGIWDDICTKRARPVSALYVGDGCADSRIHFKAMGHSPIAYIVENELIIHALHKQIKNNCPNIELMEEANISGLSVPDNLYENVTLELESGAKVESSLLIAADGAKSKMRAKAGIEFVDNDYGQMSIVCTLKTEKVMDNSIAWQRFMPSGPVALLPLTDGLSSLVWTTSTAEAKRLLELSNNLFVDELNRTLSDCSAHNEHVNRFLNIVGRFLNCLPAKERPSKFNFPVVLSLPYDDRAAFPLTFGYASNLVRARVALIGDAAHRIHPLAGQGVNLGWADVLSLTKALELANTEGGDFGSLTYLREFDSESQRNNVPKMATIDCLNRLFSTDAGPYVFLRSIGFNTLDRILPAKDLIVHMAS